MISNIPHTARALSALFIAACALSAEKACSDALYIGLGVDNISSETGSETGALQLE